ncbi:MAG: cysteine hydrolase family protein [Acidimicrobiales bacterium]
MPAPDLADLVRPDCTALLLQEVQAGVVGRRGTLGGLADAAMEVDLVGRLQALTAAARSCRVPVVHCTAAEPPHGFGANRNAGLFVSARRAGILGDPHAELVQPLPEVFEDGDIVLPRLHGLSPLTGTPLDSLLRNQSIATLVITGVSLNIAVPNLVFDAVNRSYRVVVVTDAVVGVPVEYGRQVVAHSLRPLATLVETAQLLRIWGA